MTNPKVVSFGGGVNSTAMLIGMYLHQIFPQLILFADTGDEKPETYEHIEKFSVWLVDRGFPAITTVRRNSKHKTLENECLNRHMLPAKAFHRSFCSMDWKVRPQEQFVDKWMDTRRWKYPVHRYIGFDASEAKRAKESPSPLYLNIYLLREWAWDYDKCREVIEVTGLTVPKKSACFYCPSSKPEEVLELRAIHPDLYERALAIQSNADYSGVMKVEGLGGTWAWGKELTKPVHCIEQSCGCFDGES